MGPTPRIHERRPMNTLQFLQRVLPPTGCYALLIINPDRRRQTFYTTIEKLVAAAVRSNSRGENTYYAISAFQTPGSRQQDNVLATKVVALDVDCGPAKPFADWREGLQALGKFVTEAALPKPVVVHSGVGLHVYWVLTEALGPADWAPLAGAMKAATVARGFLVDAAVSADSARVLRPPGTHNPKNGAVVRVLIDAPDVPPAKLAAALGTVALPQSPRVQSALAQALQIPHEFPPANPDIVATKCAQVGWGIKDQGEVEEPFWYAMLGIAAYCQEPETTALAWSSRHPKFRPEETLAKLAQWQRVTTGPATCSRFASLRPAGCNGCKFRDKLTTPARLGVQYLELAPTTSAPATVPIDTPLPRPFKRTTDGIKLTIDDTDIDVCKFDVYPVAYGRDEGLGYEVVRFCWERPHVGWQELIMRQALLTDGHRDFATVVADQGIVLPNRSQTGHFQNMLRSYMDALRQKRSMTNLYSSMGWKDNFTQFVIGDTVIRRDPDGAVADEHISLAAGSTRLGHELWTTAGSLEAWAGFTALTEKADLRVHMFALCVGMSAPLYAFTGLKGLTVSLCGPTGGGKSLAQMWVQSIWGNPDKLHFAAKYTQNTLFNRMGLHAHMPMTIDEVTLMDDKDVGDFAYWVSQGRDKARLTRDAVERDAKTWSLPVIVSTNRSLGSKLVAGGLDTDAQLARILEIPVPASALFTRDSSAGRKLYEFVTSNYGHAGREFVRQLLTLGEPEIRKLVSEATNSFRARYKAKFAGEERYWEQAIILADLAGRLAKDWGLITYNYKTGIEWVLAQVGAIRRTLTEFRLDSFDLLSEYLNESANMQVQIFHTGTQKKPTIDHTRLPRGEVRVRFEFYRKSSTDPVDRGVVMLDRTHLRRWLSQRGADYRAFVNDFAAERVLLNVRANKAYLAKDTPIKLGQSYVVALNLDHDRLRGMLNDADELLDELAFGKLRVVQ